MNYKISGLIMQAFFQYLFNTESFMPHGMCFQWQSDILSMFVIADIVITLAYISIAFSLAWFVTKRSDLKFNHIILSFSLFIFACGATHALSAITIWLPIYELSAWLKVFTALVSTVTAVMLWPLLPRLLKIPSSNELVELNKHLMNEISVHQATKEQLMELAANLDEMVEQRTLKLKKSDQIKGEFIAHVSHELKTPLHGLLGFTQILQEDQDLKDDQKEKLAIIHECGDSLLLMINDLLDVGVHDKDGTEVVYSQFNLLALLSGVEKISRQLCQNLEVEFNLQFQNDLPQYVLGDEKLIRQLLINLVTNAIKFTKVGTVCLRVYQDHNRFCFQVKDTGQGIAEDEINNIFDPYYRGKVPAESQGMGLGLAICRRIATILDSEIKVNSVVNEGSIFEFTVELELMDQCLPDHLALKSPIGYEGVEQTIMVVDDNQANRNFIEEMLFAKGFNVLSVESGEQCLALVDRFKPDLILMDLKMPGLNGIETTEKLNETSRQWKVIAISASALETDKISFTAAGGIGFLSKPLNSAELYRCLEQHLAIKWLTDSQDNRDLVARKISTISILLVDDNVVNTQWLKSLLHHKGHDVEVVDNCSVALEKLKLIDYDLIIIDRDLYQMGRDDQLELFLRTKKPKMPAIVLENASIKTPELELSRTDVFNYYLKLPSDWKKLDGLIAAI